MSLDISWEYSGFADDHEVAGANAHFLELFRTSCAHEQLFAIMVIVEIVGTALDMTPTILILTPIVMPIVKQAGIDPLYFGVLFIINNAIGLITPPVSVVLNVVCGVSRVAWKTSSRAGRSCSRSSSCCCCLWYSRRW